MARTGMRLEEARFALAERLRARRDEIEQAVLTRIYSISSPSDAGDPAYLDGLRAAVSAALDYGIAGVADGERHPPAVPAAPLAQARVAARSGVRLDTVLRRYFAGYALLGDFLVEEAEEDSLDAAVLKRLLRGQATLFDRLLAAVSEEHAREVESRPVNIEQRRADRVRGLLAGELLDTSELAYDFDAFHLGALAMGPGAAGALRALAASLDQQLLLVRPDERAAWAWLGGQRSQDLAKIDPLLSSSWPTQAVLSLGEPAEGLAGWRLSHRQARAALSTALLSGKRIVRYRDVALLASALQDDLLVISLRRFYLDPLRGERDGGEAAKETLRAYFAAALNVSSTAAALGISRRTVTSRLRMIEDRLGRPLEAAAAEIETALRLDELGEPHFGVST